MESEIPSKRRWARKVEISAAHFLSAVTSEGSFALAVSSWKRAAPTEGAIVNELFEDESGTLQLRFYGYLGLRGKAPGGAEE